MGIKMCSVIQSKSLCLVLLCSLILFECGEGGQIVIFSAHGTGSQTHVYVPFARKLMKAKHEVTLILPSLPVYTRPNDTIHYLIPDKFAEDGYLTKSASFGRGLVPQRLKDVAAGGTMNPGWSHLPEQGVKACELFLSSDNVVQWLEKIRKDNHVDLVIVDGLFNDCGVGLAQIFRTPFIFSVNSPLFPSFYDEFGVNPETSWLSDVRKRWPALEPLTFFQRLENTLRALEMYFLHKQFSGYYENLDALFRPKFQDDTPAMQSLVKGANLVLLNSHYSLEAARSLPPLFVPVGGMHCADPDDITPELAEFVDGFSGFIYVSFGTLARLPHTKQNLFFKVFSKFSRIGFVMKWTRELPPKIPSNVKLLPYAPQQALLAHKKALIFISHGGFLSVQEAAYHGVPVIGVPIFSDQDFNLDWLTKLNVAVRLEIANLTLDELHGTILQVLNNPGYRLRMKDFAKVYKDRPQSPISAALWWTEYILRHSKDGNLDNLKPLSIHQFWFQRRCLDVWGFLFLTALLLVYLSIKILFAISALLCRLLCGRGKVKSE